MNLLKRNILNRLLKDQEETHRIDELEEHIELLKENQIYTEELASCGSWTQDLQKDTIFWSDGIYNILESDPEEMKNDINDFYKYIHEDDMDKVIEYAEYAAEGMEYNLEYRIISSKGREKTVGESLRIIYDENKLPIKIIGVIRDITGQKSVENKMVEIDEENLITRIDKVEVNRQIKKLQEEIDLKQRKMIQMERQMDYLNTYDRLTGLPNHLACSKKLRLQSQYARENRTTFALMMLEIDEFKYIKYSLGNEVGDLLIVEIVDRLKVYLGEKTFISRYSEDSFDIVVQDLKELGDYEIIAAGIIDLFNKSFEIKDYSLNINLNIGICIFPKGASDTESLSKHSKAALLQAKEKGRNLYKFYCCDLDRQNYKNLTLGSDLNNALKMGQISINYQPMINLKDNRILGVETLIKWNHPHLGIISQEEFIHLAEKTGLIIQIENWALKQVCKAYKGWLKEGLPAIKVAVRFSGIHFLQEDFIKDIKDIIDGQELDPSFLIIGITESVLVENSDTIVDDLKVLQSYGSQIGIDDLGTGLVSLQYLKHLNIDILKLGGSFIKDIAYDDNQGSIAKSTIKLAKELKIKLVVEGIEDREQLSFLKDLNCHTGQGHIFSKPVPLSEFEKILAMKKCRAKQLGGVSRSHNKERRDFFRIRLFQLLEGELTIIEIRGSKVNVGSAKVLIKDMGAGGLCFISNIKIPKEKDIALQITTNLLDQEIKVCGHLVCAEEIENNLSEYRVKFKIDENKRMNLIRILNEVQIKMRKNTLFTEGDFITGSYGQYFN